jgi:hypothetical protein
LKTYHKKKNPNFRTDNGLLTKRVSNSHTRTNTVVHLKSPHSEDTDGSMLFKNMAEIANHFFRSRVEYMKAKGYDTVKCDNGDAMVQYAVPAGDGREYQSNETFPIFEANLSVAETTMN